jgi:hypothetical protein
LAEPKVWRTKDTEYRRSGPGLQTPECL